MSINITKLPLGETLSDLANPDPLMSIFTFAFLAKSKPKSVIILPTAPLLSLNKRRGMRVAKMPFSLFSLLACPVPNCPDVFSPQQKARPEATVAQVVFHQRRCDGMASMTEDRGKKRPPKIMHRGWRRCG